MRQIPSLSPSFLKCNVGPVIIKGGSGAGRLPKVPGCGRGSRHNCFYWRRFVVVAMVTPPHPTPHSPDVSCRWASVPYIWSCPHEKSLFCQERKWSGALFTDNTQDIGSRVHCVFTQAGGFKLLPRRATGKSRSFVS